MMPHTRMSAAGLKSFVAAGLLIGGFVVGTSFGIWTEKPKPPNPDEPREVSLWPDQEIMVEYDNTRFWDCHIHGGVIVIPFDRWIDQHTKQVPACVSPWALEPLKERH